MVEPFRTLTFLSHVFLWIQKHLCNNKAPAHADCDTDWESDVAAFEFAEGLLRHLALSGAPMLLVFTGYQIVVVERRKSATNEDIQLDVHQVVLSQLGPEPGVEPNDPNARELLEQWSISQRPNLPLTLALMAIRAENLPHVFRPFVPCGSPIAAQARTEDARRLTRSQAERQRLASNALLYHFYPFAHGAASEVFHACLIPPDQTTCADLPYFTDNAHAECSTDGHQRVVAKVARTRALPGEKWSIDAQEQRESLEREAKLYKALVRLQGSTLPCLLGRWEDAFVYEDVGTSVSLRRSRICCLTMVA